MTSNTQTHERQLLKWNFHEEHRAWYTDVPVRDFENKPGTWRIIAYPRPHYCDRGKWQVMVEDAPGSGVSPLDDAEFFPRFYFKLENMKSEIQQWVLERQQCIEGWNAIPKLSNGEPSTLFHWLVTVQLEILAGTMKEAAAQYILRKINSSPQGENEEVVAPESQVLHLLRNMQ